MQSAHIALVYKVDALDLVFVARLHRLMHEVINDVALGTLESMEKPPRRTWARHLPLVSAEIEGAEAGSLSHYLKLIVSTVASVGNVEHFLVNVVSSLFVSLLTSGRESRSADEAEGHGIDQDSGLSVDLGPNLRRIAQAFAEHGRSGSIVVKEGETGRSVTVTFLPDDNAQRRS